MSRVGDERRDGPSGSQMPPGTVYLGNEIVHLDGVEHGVDGQVMLQPRPSTDPNEPLNWSRLQKAINYALGCLFTLMVFATLDVGTVTWPSLTAELGYDSEYLTYSYAAGLAGLGVGCVLFIPAAVLLGRKPVYLCASLTMVFVNVGQALFRTKAQYIVLQVLAGLAGSVNDTIIQMTIIDLFFVHQRATVNGIYCVMVVAGTYLSLIPAGYIIRTQGWRWVWWWCAILNGVVLVLIIIGFEETRYSRQEENCFLGQDVQFAESLEGKKAEEPVLCEKKQQSSRPETFPIMPAGERPVIHRRKYFERVMFSGPPSDLSIDTYWRHLRRPFFLFFRIPAVTFVAIEYSIMLCWVAVLATTQPLLFAAAPYNFSSVGVGNINVSPFLGAFLGSVYGGPLNDYYVVKMASKRSGVYDPEMRLHMLLAPLVLTPLGLFLYGISIAHVCLTPVQLLMHTYESQEQHWIVPLIGSGLVGFGLGSSTSIILPYFGDSYPELVAEGLVAITYIRNGIATAAAFAISPWMNGLGVEKMFVSAGCICFGILVIAIPMIIWGRSLRSRTAEIYFNIVAQG
ncbi:major facilitator superfamily domain-containing protein [Aspergillus affinis]|uniref:major facilitator superfamily domain-containing protein n=1 Tax=Aspergillus affinis TaxID=1070780 RepID=UPI0022FECEB3|nr:major facilitator superfamily domain-containing protein [Aspergillus affinis]KAI9041846.1 major facilitator superfamily domain-containing protein [Aspergillus affinis]